MEKNIPGLRKQYKLPLARLRAGKPSLCEATHLLEIWSAKYREYVTEGDDYESGVIYGRILNAYALREALKQYIEELKGNQNHVRT